MHGWVAKTWPITTPEHVGILIIDLMAAFHYDLLFKEDRFHSLIHAIRNEHNVKFYDIPAYFCSLLQVV